jgi:hypothetical protein
MAAYGLYTHIQSNKRRSIALLIGLFFLVYVLVFAGALLAEALSTDAPLDVLIRAAKYDFVMALPWATLGTLVWIAIAYKFHQSMIDAVTGAHAVTRTEEPRLVVARHLASPGDRVDHRLVESVGDQDPGDGAERRPRQGGDEILPRARDQPAERGIAHERLRRQRAGEHHHVDQEEQPDQQRDRPALVRLDVGVKTVGVFHGRPEV